MDPGARFSRQVVEVAPVARPGQLLLDIYTYEYINQCLTLKNNTSLM
jgi:hypothetical protein